ncbi:MAG TPA: class I SAM-dependent methyltransferase [Frankiaceae bacterium]|nr:class I SAM-dependent methyltransferase [Frankiaceae bacterium]HEX4432479.1 class I SAM-dependent methyltransferase [Frankiaceae bacterium]
MSTDASWVESMPEVYDRALGPALFAPFAAHLAGLMEPHAPRRLLELAAGTGIATAQLVKALPACAITATDLNPAMVAWTSERLAGPSWAQADAQLLQFADGSFDAVVSQFGVMFFPDKPAAFAESARVLEPGGLMVFSVWDVVEGSPFPAAMVDSLNAVLADPPTFIVRVPHGYADPVQIADDLRAGGLEPESIDRVVLRGSSPSARTLTEGFCLGTPLRFALQECGPLDELTEALAEEMTQRLGPGPVTGELAALVVTARAS